MNRRVSPTFLRFHLFRGSECFSSRQIRDPRPSLSGFQGKVAYPNQVVDRSCEGEHPSDPSDSSMPRLAHQTHRLEPTKDFLHALPFPLAHYVTRVPGGATVNAGVGGLLRCDVGSDGHVPEHLHELTNVIALVLSERDPVLSGKTPRHDHGGVPLRGPGSLSQAHIPRPPLAG